jgi:hypothetical protein
MWRISGGFPRRADANDNAATLEANTRVSGHPCVLGACLPHYGRLARRSTWHGA